MILNLTSLIPYISVFITLVIAIGSYIGFRQSFGNSLSSTQEKVITALNEQIKVLEKKIEGQAQEIIQLKFVIAAIQDAFERRGIIIRITDDTIITTDIQVPIEHITKIMKREPIIHKHDEET